MTGDSAPPITPALVVIGTPIGNLGDLSARAVEELRLADVIACEDTRHTRKLLSHAGVSAKRLLSVHDRNEMERIDEVLGLLVQGRRVALVTDAGMPSISDPGQRLVAAAAAAGHEVVVVPGPSAVLAALVVSGLASDRFVFEGFLPPKGRERGNRLAAIAAERRTTVLYEAPHRLRRTMNELLEVCGPLRRVAVARELTKLHEEVWRDDLQGAAHHLSQTEPRGEHVIVLEGAPEPAPPSDAEIEGALSARLGAGEEKRSALAAVAAELAVPKRRVYEISLRLAAP